MAAAAAAHRISRRLSDEKAATLAKEAIQLSHAGESEQAMRKLREAAAIGPEHVDVQEAVLILHKDQDNTPLLDLCRRYAMYHDAKAGGEAARYLRSHGLVIDGETAVECLKVVLATKPTALSSRQDNIIADLARHSLDVRLFIAMELQASSTKFFEDLYERGDQAANCLRATVLDSSLWPKEDLRLRVEDDLFQLFLAKLMESGHDLDGRALKGIVLLLMADAPRLKDYIDEQGFDALLTSLDIRLPADVRGQATLVVSKYLEVAEATGKQYFTAYVSDHMKKRKADDLVLAFSAAASLFPVATNMTAPLFLTEGFLPSLLPLLEGKLGSQAVSDAFLALLNAACIDAACRATISKYCMSWLAHKVSNGIGTQNGVAGTVLAKIRTSGSVAAQGEKISDTDNDVSELVDLFKSNLCIKPAQNVSNSIEGLAYTSLKPEVKERLAQDTAFLDTLLQVLNANTTIPEIVIGGLSVVANITQYQPNLSDEQKKISQLKAYANASKPSEPSPLETEAHVSARCTAIVNAGIIPTMVKISKGISYSATLLMDKIMLSLSKNPKDRGKIAQQGAVKLLISHSQRASKQGPDKPTPVSTDPAHALARILISLDPSHVFPASGTPHITDAVAPLIALLKPPSSDEGPMPALSDQPRDLLPVFESLLALTNLASSPDQTASSLILRHAWEPIEDLLLNNNTMVRRAACELVCNLCARPEGIAKFADPNEKRSGQRVHLLLALCDVDDTKTRMAATGAMSMLTDFEEVVGSLLDVSRAPEIILDLCEDEEVGIVHRGLVVLRNMVCCEDAAVRNRAKERMVREGVVERIKAVLRRRQERELLMCGVEVLKALS